MQDCEMAFELSLATAVIRADAAQSVDFNGKSMVLRNDKARERQKEMRLAVSHSYLTPSNVYIYYEKSVRTGKCII